MNPVQRHSWMFLALLGGLLLAGFLVAQSAEKTGRQALPPVYQKWLDEDVRYIINPGERSRFLELRTDAERDEFVRQFWLRRDPTPDTEENEYKEEHYRRIAYANQHYAAKDPGWKTDRGRSYIIYGPPDEITKEQAEAGHAMEVWRYKKSSTKTIVLRFIDSCDCGEFQLKR